MGLATILMLPPEAKRPPVRYPALLLSMLRLLRDQPRVRWAIGIQMPVFAAFNMVWVMIVFPLTQTYGMTVAAAGLFGLISLITVVTTPFVGRLLDRVGHVRVMTIAMAVLIGGAVIMLASELTIVAMVLGIMSLNIGMQSLQIANQTRVLTLLPEASSRLNTLYMTSNFAAGAVSSLLAAQIFAAFGWRGLTLGALATACLAAAMFALERVSGRIQGVFRAGNIDRMPPDGVSG